MNREIILFRHGIAEDYRGSDFDRALTEEGIRKMEEMGRWFSTNVKHEHFRIISSPLVRAKETAEIIAQAIHVPVEIEDWVVDGVFTKLFSFEESELPIIVGHNPTLEIWHMRLTGGDHDFKKGSFCHYEVSEPTGQCIQCVRYKEIKGGKHEI